MSVNATQEMNTITERTAHPPLVSSDLLSGEKASSEIYCKAWRLQMANSQVGIDALAKIMEGNYGSEDVKCIARDALDKIERNTKQSVCQ